MRFFVLVPLIVIRSVIVNSRTITLDQDHQPLAFGKRLDNQKGKELNHNVRYMFLLYGKPTSQQHQDDNDLNKIKSNNRNTHGNQMYKLEDKLNPRYAAQTDEGVLQSLFIMKSNSLQKPYPVKYVLPEQLNDLFTRYSSNMDNKNESRSSYSTKQHQHWKKQSELLEPGAGIISDELHINDVLAPEKMDYHQDIPPNESQSNVILSGIYYKCCELKKKMAWNDRR